MVVPLQVKGGRNIKNLDFLAFYLAADEKSMNSYLQFGLRAPDLGY